MSVRVRVMSPSCRACRRPYFHTVDGVPVCTDCGHPYEPVPLPFAVGPESDGGRCPGGHTLDVEMIGWAPCTCRGHRINYCRCGMEVHVLPTEPKAPCSCVTRPWSEQP